MLARLLFFAPMARKTTKPSRAYSEKNPLPLVGVFFLRAAVSGGARALTLFAPCPPPSTAALSGFPTPPFLSAATAADKKGKVATATAGAAWASLRGRISLHAAAAGG